MKTKLLRKVRKRFKYYFLNGAENPIRVLDTVDQEHLTYISIRAFLTHINYGYDLNNLLSRISKESQWRKREGLKKIQARNESISNLQTVKKLITLIIITSLSVISCKPKAIPIKESKPGKPRYIQRSLMFDDLYPVKSHNPSIKN